MQRVSPGARRALLVAVIIFAAVLIRAYNINGALFDFNPCRQAVTAAIARNFAQDTDASILLPRADNEGPNPGYFMFEFPILAYATSFLVRSFGDHNWVFRLLPILFFGASASVFYVLCRRVFGERTALFSLIFYCIAPITILMGRVIQSESLMMLTLFTTLYFFVRWLEDERPADLLFSTAGLTVLVLLKITNLYVLLFLAALFLIYGKPRMMLRAFLPVFFALGVNFWWWILYSGKIRAMYPTGYTDVGNVSVFTLKHISDVVMQYSFSASYWLLTLKHCSWVIFSPLIFVLFITGIFVKKEKRSSLFLMAWLGAALFFIFAVPSAASQDYYKIHIVPAGSVLAAMGYLYIYDRVKAGAPGKAFIAVLWTLILANIFLIVFPVIRYKPIFEYQQEIGKKVAGMAEKGDLVIASFGPDPMLLYYCNRKGWTQYLPEEEDNIGLLERRRKEGAKYFVCGNLNELDSDPVFKEYLRAHYRVAGEGERMSGEPGKGSLEYLAWQAAGGIKQPFSAELRKKLEQRSLGYVIFDLRSKN